MVVPNHCRSVVFSAARNVEERDLIGAIVDEPLAALPRKKYEKWLTAQKDARVRPAGHLREKAARIAKAKKLPDFGYPFYRTGYSKAWKSMLGESLFGTLTESDANWQLKDMILKYANPRLGIKCEDVGVDEMPIEGSRFGGRAALPADVEWPSCAEGSLGYLGQIALDEIQTMQAARFLPAGGWLSFFALNDNVGGNSAEDDFRVVYTAPTKQLVWRDPPEDTEYKTASTCRLIFEESWDLPEGDHVVTKTDRKIISEINKAHDIDLDHVRRKFGDYDAHLLGDLRHYRTDFVARTATDRNLLCLGSIDSLGWNWCDGEHLSFFIEKKDLKAKAFGKARAYAA